MSLKVIERNWKFEPNEELSFPHQPTNGHDIAQTAKKVGHLLASRASDALFSASLPKHQQENPKLQLVHSRLNQKGALFSQSAVVIHQQFLSDKYPEASIYFLANGLGSGKNIQGSDPLRVITGIDPFSIQETEKEEDWIDLQISREEKPIYNERIIAYPFVFPGKGIFSFPHVVLIIIDQEEEIVYYYDPQGLTSDDPCRLKIFADHPYFDMHQNLLLLAKELFPNGAPRVIENIAAHQTDPVNCGTLVCRALARLYEGKPVEEALQFDRLTDSLQACREEVGRSVLASIDLIPGKLSQAEEETLESRIICDDDLSETNATQLLFDPTFESDSNCISL